MSTPRHFWVTHAYPDYQDYMADQGDERKAMHSALSAFHMADYVWTYHHPRSPGKVFDTKNAGDYGGHLATHCCSDFALLRDIAEAHKHMKLTRPNTPPRRVTSSTSVRIENIPGVPLGSFVLGSSVLGGDAMMIDLDDGSQRVFGEVLGNVFAMWERLIEQHDL